jgi:hypothetical protein
MLYFEAKPLKSTDHQGAATLNKTELGKSSLALLQSSRRTAPKTTENLWGIAARQAASIVMDCSA